MKQTLLILCLALAPALLLTGPAYADVTTVPVTANAHADIAPHVHGNYIVWQGHVDGDWEVFLYNIATGQTTQVTENDYDDFSPQTDGNDVVWVGYNRPGGEIFLYHIGEPTPIIDGANALTNDTNVDSSPQIANGRVVWVSSEVTDAVLPGNVMLYEGGGTFTKLSNSATGVSTPRMSDDAVAWLEPDPDNPRHFFLYRYDFQTKSTSLSPDHVWDDPQSDGPLQVLIRFDGHDREIHVVHGVRGSDQQITNNGVEDSHASISGNVVVWIEGEGEASEIYMAIYTLFSPVRPVRDAHLYGPFTFSWEAIGYENFQLQFSGKENFADPELSLPSATPVLSETSYTPTESEWESIVSLGKEGSPIYWRVAGTDVQGNTADTDEWRFTAALAEQGTGGDSTTDSVGDGSGGPTCFISTVADSASPQ
jgi:beta propeller repeat protein